MTKIRTEKGSNHKDGLPVQFQINVLQEKIYTIKSAVSTSSNLHIQVDDFYPNDASDLVSPQLAKRGSMKQNDVAYL